MGVEKSLWIFSDRRAGREHFQALGHRRWERNTSRWRSTVGGTSAERLPNRYREFPKFEKHLELEARPSSFWNLYGRNPSSSKSTESSHNAVKREARKFRRWTARRSRGSNFAPSEYYSENLWDQGRLRQSFFFCPQSLQALIGWGTISVTSRCDANYSRAPLVFGN